MVAQLVPEVFEMLFAEASFKKRPGIYARGGMTLEVDEIARLGAVRAVEKMVVTHLKQRGERGISGDVAADPLVDFILAMHHGHGVPAHQALDAAFEVPVAGVGSLLADG